MQPRDLFGVALRMLGIWFLSDAGYRGVYLILKIQAKLSSEVPATADKLLIGFYVLMALILLAGANGIVRLCYGPDKLV
jgi:hypothetical protein